MSSFSSNKTMNTATMCSLPEKIPDNAKNYICPRCNKFYDFQMAGNNFAGRIPLILNCKHTLCQDCVYKMYSSKDIICGECHTSNFLTDIELKKKADQIFPVNFYILGVLTYHKRFGHDSSSINFKPAGYQFKQKSRGQEEGPQSFLNFNATQTKRNSVEVYNFTVEETRQVCSQVKCMKEAKLNCSDCDEIYCKQCSDTLHNSAKGLKKHKIVPISTNSELELTEKCKDHENSLIEVYCETCNENICIYCVLSEHNGHKFYQFADLSDGMKRELKSLVDSAEEVLKKLIMSEKKIKNQVNKISKPSYDTSIELTISKKIENAISKLQVLETQLLKEAYQYNNLDRDALLKLLESLMPNIRKINNLVSVGKEVLDKKSPKSRKLNVSLVIKQLETIPNIPCYFLEDYEKKENAVEFSFDDSLIDDIQDSSKLKCSKSISYTLVTKDELPEDYVEQDVDLDETLSMMSSCSSLKDLVEKPVETVRSKKGHNKEQVERWVRSTDKPPPGTGIAKELELFKVPSLQKGDKEGVKVSHLSSPDCFYVQLNQLAPMLNKLEKSIARYAKMTPIVPVKEPQINSLYLVKYMSDQQVQWCRGRIVDELSDRQMYVAYFVDYGNTATVRKDDINAISSELKKYSPLAIECKIFDLYPPKGEWDPKVLFLITRIIANTDLLMIVIEREAKKLAVDLLKMECLTSVRDALKFLGYGIPYCKQPTELDRLKKELKRVESVKLYNKTEQFKKEDSVDVILCYVIDPYNIYVNMKSSKDHLTNLHQKMNTFYKTYKKGNIYVPKEEMVIAVNYTDGKSNSWRRGIILNSSEGRGMVTVRLVDIGMVQSVSWDQIRKLDPQFVSIDCQAILVKMTDIAPRNEENLWPQNAIDYFTKFIKAQTVLKMVISETRNPPEVVLFECFPTVHTCLNAVLVRDGLAESTGDLSITVEWPQMEYDKDKAVPESFTMSLINTIQATAHEINVIDEIDADDEDTNLFRKSIEIISADSPDLIYFRLTDLKDKLHEFQLEMREFYRTNKLIYSFWKIGDICVAYHKKQYYRAVIQESLKDKKFLVNLKDVGTSVEVKAKQIGVLDPKFLKEPEFALRCHLADITPAGGTKKWSAIACEYLQDVFKKHHRLYMAKKGAVDKERKSFSAVIWYVEFLPGGALESSKSVLHSINKLLLKNGLALKSVVAKPVKVKEEEIKKDENEEMKKQEGVETDMKVADSIENGDDASIKSTNTETEDHELSSSNSSVAGAVKPSTSKIDWNDLIEMQKQCPAQIIQDWILPLPFKSNEFQAIPTFVNDDGDIFLHDIDLEIVLREMEEKMFDYLNSKEDEVENCWTAGEMCSVNYHGNNKWYRGKVLSVNESAIKVVMIDYGNEEDCISKDLSKEILYYDLPVFASRICLDGVYPKTNKWLTSDLDILHAQIVEKTVSVTLRSQQIVGTPTPAEVKLGNLSINTFIMEHSNNLSKIKRPKINTNSPRSSSSPIPLTFGHDNILESSDADVLIEETSSLSDENEIEDKCLDIDEIDLKYEQRPLPEIKPEKRLEIAIINLLNYNKFVIEIPSENFEDNKVHFENLSKQINASVSELENLEEFEVGTPCVAKYHEDEQWYRAQIIKDIDENKTCVWFVDFGNFEHISKASIKEIKEEWLEFPVEHHIATLDGIILTNETKMGQVLKEMVSYYGKLQLAEVTSIEPLKIKLYKVDTPNELTYQNLINAGCLDVVVEDSDENAEVIDSSS